MGRERKNDWKLTYGLDIGRPLGLCGTCKTKLRLYKKEWRAVCTCCDNIDFSETEEKYHI